MDYEQATKCFAETVFYGADLVTVDSSNIVDLEERRRQARVSNIKKVENSPTASLSRYQFMESLVHLAVEKYHEGSEVEKSVANAVRRLIE